MSDTQWVQHKSGQGEKWEVTGDETYEWLIRPKVKNHSSHFVPKSEFVPCDPPTSWVDVTEECEAYGTILFHRHEKIVPNDGYRLRKADMLMTNGPITERRVAFIVEQEVSHG